MFGFLDRAETRVQPIPRFSTWDKIILIVPCDECQPSWKGRRGAGAVFRVWTKYASFCPDYLWGHRRCINQAAINEKNFITHSDFILTFSHKFLILSLSARQLAGAL